MYSQYCANFNVATEELIALRERNKNFRLFEEEVSLNEQKTFFKQL